MPPQQNYQGGGVDEEEDYNHTPQNTHNNLTLLYNKILTSLFPTPITTPLLLPNSSPFLHNILAQAAQFSLLLFFLVFLKNPENPLLKVLALGYSVCQVGWCWWTLGAVDLVFWGGAVGVAVVGSWGAGICRWCGGWRRRRSSGDREVEKVYTTLFSPLQITRAQFSKILSCRRNQLKILQPGEHYAREKVTRVDSLGVVLSGKLLVTQSSRPLHIIHPNQFVDSPEYFGVSTDDLFQVSITAVEESRLLVWHRDKLRLCISENDDGSGGSGGGFLREMFDHVIGRDVVRKLVQVSDSVGGAQQQDKREQSQSENVKMVIPTGGGVAEEEDEEENHPLVLDNVLVEEEGFLEEDEGEEQPGEGAASTSNTATPLDNNSWAGVGGLLGKIAEEETVV